MKVEGGPSLILDGVLRSSVDQISDVVVEIKVVGTSWLRNLRNRVDEAIAIVTRYRRRVDARAHGWLIIVVEEASVDEIRRITDATRDVRDLITVSVVTEQEIDDLDVPRFPSP